MDRTISLSKKWKRKAIIRFALFFLLTVILFAFYIPIAQFFSLIVVASALEKILFVLYFGRWVCAIALVASTILILSLRRKWHKILVLSDEGFIDNSAMGMDVTVGKLFRWSDVAAIKVYRKYRRVFLCVNLKDEPGFLATVVGKNKITALKEKHKKYGAYIVLPIDMYDIKERVLIQIFRQHGVPEINEQKQQEHNT